MKNFERAAYIRGLMEGMELDPNAKETKLFNAIVELLDDLSASVEELEDGFAELSDTVDELDHDLGDVEEEVYGLDEDCDDCGCGCGCHHHHHHDDEDDDWDLHDEYTFEVTCPSCGTTMELDDEDLEAGSILCTECGETLEFDFDDLSGMDEITDEDIDAAVIDIDEGKDDE